MNRKQYLVILVALLSLTDSSHADPVPQPVTMDRFGETSMLGVSLGYAETEIDATVVRAHVTGQYVWPSGFGAYAQVPAVIVLDGNADSALGNIEVGALAAHSSIPFILRLGLVAATADRESVAANAIGALTRFTDAPQHTPNVTWLRLSAHPKYRHGNAFVRSDIGIDVAIAEDIDGDVDDKLVRANFAVGGVGGRLALAVEFTNTYNLGDVSNKFVSSVGASARHLGPHGGQTYVGFQVPLDSEIQDVVQFVLVAGFDFGKRQRSD